MNCNYCAIQLSSEAQICPNCGRPTPNYYSTSGTTSDEPTDIRSHSASIVVDQDSASYSNPHTSHTPYTPSDPYSAPVPPPPPIYDLSSSAPYPPYAVPRTMPSPLRRSNRLLLNVGVGLLILILLAGGILAFFSRSRPEKTIGQNQNVPATAQSSAVDVQALYNHITSGNPVVTSSLSGPDNYGWDDYAQRNTHCWFTAGAYHSEAEPKYFSPCYALATNFSNFLFQANITLLSGHSGGLVFRADGKNDNGYYFRVSTDGTYILNKVAPNTLQPLLSGSSVALHKGLHQANLLAVLTQGDHISLFVNKQYIASITDDTYHAGQIGVYVDSDAGRVEASFHQAQVWNT